MSFKIKHILQWGYRVMVLPAVFLVGGLFITVPFSSASDVDTTSMDVIATVISPACTINLSPPVLPPFDVDSATLRRGAVSDSTQKVILSLTACGFGYATKAPVIVLSGNHPDEAELPAGTHVGAVFKDPNGTDNTAEGFWVVVGRIEAPRDITDLYQEGDAILVGDVNTSGEGTENSIYIGVSCMDSTPCGKKAGSLKATLRFTFKYQ